MAALPRHRLAVVSGLILMVIVLVITWALSFRPCRSTRSISRRASRGRRGRIPSAPDDLGQDLLAR